MKILVPLREFEQIQRYCDAGADEFYFGFDDEHWCEQFGDYQDMNRMSAMKKNANHFSSKDVPRVIEEIHKQKKTCYITLNSNIYNAQQVNYLGEFLDKLNSKPDGVIFSDIQLLDVIKKANLKPVVSTMCASYNTDIISYYCKKGVDRIIFPREISLKEMEEFVKKYPKVDFEAFVMRDGCIFSDSNCLGVHQKNHGGICSFIRQNDCKFHLKDSTSSIQHKKYRHFLYTDALLRNACGLCAIYELLQLEVAAGKIVGRADHTEEVEKDIKAVFKNREIALECNNQQEYLKKMFLPDRWKMICGLSCYYPEICEKRSL